MRFIDWIHEAYGKMCCDQSIGWAMILSYIWIYLFPVWGYLLVFVGIFYIIFPLSPFFRFVEKRVETHKCPHWGELDCKFGVPK